MSRLVVCLVSLLAMTFLAGAASGSVPASRMEAWSELQAARLPEAVVRWSPDYGTPTSIVNTSTSLPVPGWKSGPEYAVLKFLADNGGVFGTRSGLDEFRVVRRFDQEGVVQHVVVQQYYRGLPVVGAQYSVAVRADGTLSMLAGCSVAGITVDIVPRIDKFEAMSRLSSAGKLEPGGQVTMAELSVLPSKQGASLVYHVTVADRDGVSVSEADIAADDGRILGWYDDRCYAVGRGLAYLYEPTGTPTPITFNIDAPGDAVTSSHFRVRNMRGADLPTSAAGRWLYSWSQPPTDVQFAQFDMVQAFALADTFVDDYAVGANHYAGPAIQRPLQINVNFEASQGNPGWATRGSVNFMGANPQGKSAARDPDYLLHEMEHYLMWGYNIEPNDPANILHVNEASAVCEGTADFFACSFTGDPAWGEWYYGIQGGLTNVANSPYYFNYGNYTTVHNTPIHGELPQYRVGQIWSGTLWNLREQIGRTAENLIARSMAYWPAATGMPCGGDAILAADRDFYASAHVPVIRNVFASRGIPASSLLATIVGPTMAGQYTGVWTASACCGMPPYTYQWSKLACTNGAPDACSWTTLGIGNSQTTQADGVNTMRCVVTDSQGASATASVDLTYPTIDVIGANPSITITGPDQLTAEQRGTFAALRAGGMRPYSYSWLAQFCIDCALEPVGSSSTLTIASSQYLILKCILTDGAGRAGTTSKWVSIVQPPPGKTAPSSIAEGASSVDRPGLWASAPSTGRLAFRLNSAADSPARIDVYDLAGRRVLPVFEGAVTRGENRMEVSSRGLPKGLYLARSRQGDVVHTARFLMLN